MHLRSVIAVGPRLPVKSTLGLGALALALAGSGCSSLSGKWVGSCEYDDARYGYTSAITVQMEDGSGSDIAGDVTLDMFDGRTFSGRLRGLRSDTYIEMDGTVRKEDGEWEISLSGDIGEDVIEGECGLSVPLGAGALIGDLTLER